MAKVGLNKRNICQAAIDLIDAEGLKNLSMRKLAKRLNVKAASLYNHVHNKSALLDLIQAFLYNHLPVLTNTKDWKKHLMELANATRWGLLHHPNMLTLFATRPTITEAALNQAEQTLGLLLQAGFNQDEVLMIFRNLNVFILGHVLAEVGRPPGTTKEDVEPSIATTNIDKYPILQKASSYKKNIDFDYGFKVGITSLIKGYEHALKKQGSLA